MRKPEAMIGRIGAGAILLVLALAAAPPARGQEIGLDPGSLPPHAAHTYLARKQSEAGGAYPRVKPPSRKQSKMIHLHHEQAPVGMFGPYPLMRESSGTAWQPESTIHEGRHYSSGPWFSMVHGWATAVWDNQGGPRGAQEYFGGNMLMGRTHGPLGPGTLGLRVMLSAEPATIGSEGYPLLLQTGESADGNTPLIDRQHPHDLTMELATSYSVSPEENASAFVYAGLPGEPALGPPVFMHRFSGESFPDAPIGHHWLDATHITYGVLTVGVVDGPWKLEASRFNGREPDHIRTDIEEPQLDSHSFRVSHNPGPNLALQGSYGRLHSPEALEPDVDVDRITVSAIVNAVGRGRMTQTTFAWGRNENRPGHTLDAFLFETTTNISVRHTWMTRIEQVEKDELFPAGDARAGQVHRVGKVSAGYRYDIWPRGPLAGGIGAIVSLLRVPDALDGDYGNRPISGLAFVRVMLR